MRGGRRAGKCACVAAGEVGDGSGGSAGCSRARAIEDDVDDIFVVAIVEDGDGDVG